jgi:8-oxo-dGTP pyrophosphatase MutT (NUDIX family)
MSRTQLTARRAGTGERGADRPDDERWARGRSPDDGRPWRDRDPPPDDDFVDDDDGLYHPPSRRGAPRLHSKISFGIIITRVDASTNRPEAVLVRGRYSYEYAEFVHGRYSRKNTRAVAALFDAMSVNERLDIYSLDFAQMWYRIWLTAERRELYNKKFAKFQAAWMRDDSGEYLRRLVQASRPVQHDGGIRLEFPKGKRQSNREPDLNCAIRETEEETGIAKRDYQILPGFKRRVSYVHMGVRYVNVYYVAVARRDLPVGIDLRDLDQVSEVSEVRWMDIEQIRLFDTPDRRLENTVAPVFKYVKRYVRGLVPSRGLAFRLAPGGDLVDVDAHFARIEAGRAAKAAEPPPPRRDLAARDDVPIGGLPAPAPRPPPPEPRGRPPASRGRDTPCRGNRRKGGRGGRNGGKGGQKKGGSRR